MVNQKDSMAEQEQAASINIAGTNTADRAQGCAKVPRRLFITK